MWCLIIGYFVDVKIISGLGQAIMCVLMQLVLFMESIRFELEKLWPKLNFGVTCHI